MKRIVRFKWMLGLVIFSCGPACLAQSISRHVISSTGNFVSNSSGKLFFNAGELAVHTTVNSNYIFTEGFVQPFTDVPTQVVTETDEAKDISVFPNPANSAVHISTISAAEITSVELYDSQGRRIAIRIDKISATTYSLNIAFLDNGIYFFKINSAQGHVSKIIRLIKI